MIGPTYARGESLLQIKGKRAQPEAGAAGRVQSGQDTEPCEETWERGEPGAVA